MRYVLGGGGRTYCDKKALARLVKESQAAGRVSAELALMVERICLGVWQRYSLPLAGLELEELQQDLQVDLAAKLLYRMDARRNSFAYLTRVAINRLRQLARSAQRRLHEQLLDVED